MSFYDLFGLRGLTRGEKQLATSMFGSSIDYSIVEINQESFAGLIHVPSNRAMAPNGNIYFHPKNSDYRDDFSTASASLQGLFIHEMTHVWQYQSGESVITNAIFGDNTYEYELRCGADLLDYGQEQQAQIIMDYYFITNGIKTGAYGSQSGQNTPQALYDNVLINFIDFPKYLSVTNE